MSREEEQLEKDSAAVESDIAGAAFDEAVTQDEDAGGSLELREDLNDLTDRKSVV